MADGWMLQALGHHVGERLQHPPVGHERKHIVLDRQFLLKLGESASQCVMTKPKNRLRDQRSVFLGEPIPDHEDTRTAIDIPAVKCPLELYPLRKDHDIGL